MHPKRSIHKGRHTNRVSENFNLANQMDEILEYGRANGWTQQQYNDALRGNALGLINNEVIYLLRIWSVPEDFPNKRIGEYVKGSGTDRFIFREGRELTEQIVSPEIVFECLEKHLNDVLPNSGLLLIVSKKNSRNSSRNLSSGYSGI